MNTNNEPNNTCHQGDRPSGNTLTIEATKEHSVPLWVRLLGQSCYKNSETEGCLIREKGFVWLGKFYPESTIRVIKIATVVPISLSPTYTGVASSGGHLPLV